MSHDELLSALSDELDDAYSDRIEEIRKLENFASLRQTEPEIDNDALGVFRKSLIMLLYAHFEGYCKFALQCYVIYINKKRIPVRKLKQGLIASCLEGAFVKLANSQYNPVNIANQLREDRVLQSLGRRREFLIEYDAITPNAVVEINGDLCIDTESNLWSHTLKKLMFKLELEYNLVAEYQGDVNRLLNQRNAYAHGGRDRPPTENEYEEYKNTVFTLMRHLREEIQRSFAQRAYLQDPSDEDEAITA